MFERKPAVEKAPEKERKALLVSFVDHNAPDFTFNGEWASRDVLVVMRTLVRAFRKKQRAQRLQDVSDQVVLTPANGGVTNV